MQDLLALSTFHFHRLKLPQFATGLRHSLRGATLKDVWKSWGMDSERDHSVVLDSVRREREVCETLGVAVVFPGHPEYPDRLLFLEEPPLCLTYLGQPLWGERRAIAGVGSREPHHLTTQWMREVLVPFFRTHHLVTISGGARGVDQTFHDLSLATERPTIVHVPSGLAQIYPRSLSERCAEIASMGCLISRFAPSEHVRPQNFYLRNELIAQMADLVLILEARFKSGTGLTAQLALKNNIAIGVVPGHPLLPQFGGSLKLLSEGAEMIRDLQDLKAIWNRLASGYHLAMRSDQAEAPAKTKFANQREIAGGICPARAMFSETT